MNNPFAEILGYLPATVDDAPEDERRRLRESMEAMNLGGLGPAGVWKRPDGSFTVMSATRSREPA